MRAVVIHQAGAPQQLVMEERPVPQPKPGWSVIRIRAFGLNHAESITRRGGSPSVQFPRVIGIEAVGEVAATQSPALTVGERVTTLMGELGRQFDGSYEEYVLVPDTQIYPLPLSGDWAQLATIPESGYTAWGSIKNCQIVAGQSVLVRGGTSTVGIAAIQLMTAMGIHVTATTRRAEKSAFLKRQGAEAVVLDVAGKLQTTANYDAIIEFVGEVTLLDSLTHLKHPGGYLNVTGELADQWTLDGFSSFNVPSGSYLTSFQSTDINRQWLAEMMQLIADKHLEFPIGAQFTLDEIVAAHELLDAGTADGKIVVTV